MPVSLTPRERTALKGRAHALSPVVQVGHAGLTDAVIKETDRALTAHELIKVRVGDGAEDDVDTLATGLAAGTQSAVVQTIGHIVVLYRRRNKKPDIVLPK